MTYIKTIPPRDRTSANALDALQLGDSLAGLLPLDRAAKARRELGDLGIRVIRLGTITDQMLFNKDRIAAEAGKPVEIVFENSDIMPHNFVVTKPGCARRSWSAGRILEHAAGGPRAELRAPVR